MAAESAAADRGRGSPPPQPVFELTTSPHFAAWLAAQRASLVFTTYQTAKVFLIGLQPNGRLSIFERTLERVMGLHATASTLHLSTLYQIWRFENALSPGETFQGYDAVYTPRESHVTGEIDVHDIDVDVETNEVVCVGLSDRRENRTFQDLEIEEDLRIFATPHWVRLGGVVRELYDVGVLEGIVRPMAVGFQMDEIRRYLSIGKRAG
jgi:hypothetical protein